ncbi:hypothetical protein, partial [Halomonas colorata]
MPIRKFDAFVSTVDIQTKDATIPANTYLMCIKVLGGTNPVVVDRTMRPEQAIKLSTKHVRTLADAPADDPNVMSLRHHVDIALSGQQPFLERDYRPGEIVVCAAPVPLDDEFIIPRGHHLVCKRVAAGRVVFELWHPLYTTRMDFEIAHDYAPFVFKPVDDHDDEAYVQATYGLSLEIDLFSDDDAPDEDQAFVATFTLPYERFRVAKRPGGEWVFDQDEDACDAMAYQLRQHAAPPKHSHLDRDFYLIDCDSRELLAYYIEYRLSWRSRAWSFSTFLQHRQLINECHQVIRLREAERQLALGGLGMTRVVVIDADAISPVQAAPLMVPSDKVLVATNNRDVIPDWKKQVGSRSQYRLEIVSPRVPQAADMALAFIAGEWVAREPSLLALPWLLVSRDRDISALASCLLARGVACVSQVHVHRHCAPSQGKRMKDFIQPISSLNSF